MNLLNKYNVSGLEDDMQAWVAGYFESYGVSHQVGFHYDTIIPKVYREVRIPEIGRISDIIIQVTPRKIFNIECKNNDIPGVITQAIDHLRWADYSYICAHADTYIAPRDMKIMMDRGLGLLLWQPENHRHPTSLMDVLGAEHNTSSRGAKDPAIRKTIMRTLKKKDAIRTAEAHKQLSIL